MAKTTRQDLRLARHARLRKRVTGTPEKPRLAVFRSLKHISAQIIDDTTGITLVSASSTLKEPRKWVQQLANELRKLDSQPLFLIVEASNTTVEFRLSQTALEKQGWSSKP
jgi:hypothetical protein